MTKYNVGMAMLFFALGGLCTMVLIIGIVLAIA